MVSLIGYIPINGNYQYFKEGGRRVAANGRRTASDGRGAAFDGHSADRERRRKKKDLIEAAPFGRLHQMLRMDVQGGGLGGLCPPAKNRGVWGQRPPAKNETLSRNRFLEKALSRKAFNSMVPQHH